MKTTFKQSAIKAQAGTVTIEYTIVLFISVLLAGLLFLGVTTYVAPAVTQGYAAIGNALTNLACEIDSAFNPKPIIRYVAADPCASEVPLPIE